MEHVFKSDDEFAQEKSDQDADSDAAHGRRRGAHESARAQLFQRLGRHQHPCLEYHAQPIRSPQDVPPIHTINALSTLSKAQQKTASRAGEQRTDCFCFYDEADNPCFPDASTMQFVFVHALFRDVVYVPLSVTRFDDHYRVVWLPFTKGVYQVYVNTVFVALSHVAVLAGPVNETHTVVEMQEIKHKIAYHDALKCVLLYKDSFNNIYGDLELRLVPPENLVNGQIASLTYDSTIPDSKDKTQIVTEFSSIDNNGAQNIKFYFQNKSVDATSLEDTGVIKLSVAGVEKFQQEITISGLSLDKRKKLFQDELARKYSQGGEDSLKIQRANFAEELFKKVENMNLKRGLYINFQDEMGIDAGGLRREFYEMVGKTFKDARLKLFEPVVGSDSTYYFHRDVGTVKERAKYMKMAGKLMAHSILKQQLLAIDFLPTLIKLIADRPIDLEDLDNYLPNNEYENYKLLRTLPADQISEMDLYFDITKKSKTIELVPGGSNKQVTRDNVEEYLKAIAEHYLKRPFEGVVAAFKEGFETVFPIALLGQWFNPYEVSILTCGTKQITADVLMHTVHYQGGNNVLNSFFTRFIQEATQETLRGFLKFSTGSSALPFDTTDFKIRVEFHRNHDINHLPLAHTCFRSIEVPYYNSYEVMSKKLNIAFTLGIEGFGFA